MWKSLLDILFPPRCSGCRRWGAWLCHDCWRELALVRTPLCYRCGRLSADFRLCRHCRRSGGLSRLIFCGYWQDPLRRMILNLKYRRWRVLADYLVELMVTSYRLVGGRADIIVPVPLHWQRGWSRGFNQAEVLARGVARRQQINFANPLARRRFTQPQFGLIKASRLANISGAFALKAGQRDIINGKIVVVVDDVVATGSTIEECARVLRREGAKEVWGLVIARA